MEKLIITAAICGAEVTKEHNPAVPYTVEEIVREAESAYKAGATSFTYMLDMMMELQHRIKKDLEFV